MRFDQRYRYRDHARRCLRRGVDRLLALGCEAAHADSGSRSGKDGVDLVRNGIPKDFPASLVTPESVVLPLRAGVAAHGQLFLPPGGRAAARHPAVVFMHGGPIRQMLAGWHYMDYYSNAYGLNQYLASKGYVVLALNYRSGIGYGLDYREAEHYGAAGASEYNDLLSAASYLRARPDVDAGPHWSMGRQLRRLYDGVGACAQLGSVRRRRRSARRARLA